MISQHSNAKSVTIGLYLAILLHCFIDYRKTAKYRPIVMFLVKLFFSINVRGVPIWVFGIYRYLIWMTPKEANNRYLNQYLHYKQKLILCGKVSIYVRIHCSMLVVIVTCVSIVRSRQLGTHKHFVIMLP